MMIYVMVISVIAIFGCGIFDRIGEWKDLVIEIHWHKFFSIFFTCAVFLVVMNFICLFVGECLEQ